MLGASIGFPVDLPPVLKVSVLKAAVQQQGSIADSQLRARDSQDRSWQDITCTHLGALTVAGLVVAHMVTSFADPQQGIVVVRHSVC